MCVYTVNTCQNTPWAKGQNIAGEFFADVDYSGYRSGSKLEHIRYKAFCNKKNFKKSNYSKG